MKQGRLRRFAVRAAALAVLAFLAFSAAPLRADESLFDAKGNPTAYIADDSTIYLWNGDAVAYLSKTDSKLSIYAFNGTHLGWLIKGIVCDHAGKAVGFTKTANVMDTMIEPDKPPKGAVPEKLTQQFPPTDPVLTNDWSATGLESFLRGEAN